MDRLRNINVDVEKILENIYLIFFAVFIMQQFLYTTMFQITWPEHMYEDMKAVLLVVILLRYLVMEKNDWKDYVLIAIIGLGFIISWNHNGYNEIYNCFLLIIGAKGIDFRKICKVFLVVIGALLLLTFAAALTGHVENLVYHQEGRRVRMAFGVNYPTDFSAYVFYLSAVYCYLRREKIKYVEIAILVGLSAFVYLFCEARLNTICILLLAVGILYFKVQSNRSLRKGRTYQMHGGLSMLLAVIPTLCAGGVLAASWLYSEENPLLSIINRLLNNRLYFGKKGLDVYGLSILGRYIPMKGNGGTTKDVIHYFFLDSSYMYVLLQYGAVVFGIILLIFCIMNFRARARRDWAFLIIVAVIAIQCIVEHHMMAVQYDPFLFALLAVWKGTEKNKTGETLVNFKRSLRKLYGTQKD